jgi:osmotically-inducible protein OsmY
VKLETTNLDERKRRKDEMRPIGFMSLAIVMVVALIGGVVMAADNVPEDTEITRAIVDELWIDEAVDPNDIDVETHQGVVMLTGSVRNLLAKDRATSLAETISGVRAVVNRIDVEPGGTRSDSEIGTAISDALLRDPATESYEVDVEVDDGVVTLTGSVDSWHEKQLSEILAKGVVGVRVMENKIAVTPQTSRPDTEIGKEIAAYLANDVRVDDMLVQIDVDDGEVSLSGIVGSLAEKRIAISDSWVTGVTAVDASGLEVEAWMRDDMRRETLYVNRTDEQIEKSVKDAFLYDPRVFSFAPDVEVVDGTAILTGTVDNLKAKMAAEQDARNTLGVWRVKNHLKVRPPEAVSDLELANRVRSALAEDAYVERYDITVSARSGSVYLSGQVNTSFERGRAGDVAARVNGVVAVANNLTYEHQWTWKPDREIREDVRDHLFWSPFVDANEVTVSVESGVVTLSGLVDTWGERMAAEKNAWDGGAKDVRNGLAVTYRTYGPYYRYWHDPHWVPPVVP